MKTKERLHADLKALLPPSEHVPTFSAIITLICQYIDEANKNACAAHSKIHRLTNKDGE